MGERESRSGRTVLVVDDDLGFLARFSEILMDASYEVVPASSVEEAVSLVAELAIDVDVAIIGAAIWPGARLDVIRNLQQLCRNIKLIVTVDPAEAFELDRDTARNIGIVATIRRPSQNDPQAEAELLRALEQVLAAED